MGTTMTLSNDNVILKSKDSLRGSFEKFIDKTLKRFQVTLPPKVPQLIPSTVSAGRIHFQAPNISSKLWLALISLLVAYMLQLKASKLKSVV